jgi:hypothetical protein
VGILSYSTGEIINYHDLYLLIVNNTQQKRCNRCGEHKPVDQFYKVKKGKYGVMGTYKACMSDKRKQRYHSDPEFRDKQRQQARAYYQTHKDQVKASVKQWMREHPEYVKRYVLKWQQENREHYRKYIREYHRGRRKK